jgi:mono/diheme cytochrome c family protein
VPATARHLLLATLAAGLLVLASLAAIAAENETPPAAQPATDGAAVSEREVKGLFANHCSWCHGSYGMTADKAPRLAGTEMTEAQIGDRIRKGRPGYMPPFGKVLNDQQIVAFARYIKSLKPAD